MLPEEQGSAEKASKSSLIATPEEGQQQEVLQHHPALPAQLTESGKIQASEMTVDIPVSSQISPVQLKRRYLRKQRTAV